MAAQRLFVLESLSTKFTLDLLSQATVLGQYVSLGIRLLYEVFSTNCAAGSPLLLAPGYEFLGHKTFENSPSVLLEIQGLFAIDAMGLSHMRLHRLFCPVSLATVRTVGMAGLRVDQQHVSLAVRLVLRELLGAQETEIDALLLPHVEFGLVRPDPSGQA